MQVTELEATQDIPPYIRPNHYVGKNGRRAEKIIFAYGFAYFPGAALKLKVIDILSAKLAIKNKIHPKTGLNFIHGIRIFLDCAQRVIILFTSRLRDRTLKRPTAGA